jgi:aldehyde dehydrogenase (NAD+)
LISELADVASKRAYVRDRLIPALDLRPFIDGQFLDTVSEATLDVVDPMTQETLATMPCAGEEDVAAAVTAARLAFDEGPWPQMHGRERARRLLALADLIEQARDDLALLESTDAGKRLSGVSGWDIPNAAEVYRYYAGWADKISGETLPSLPDVEMSVHLEPVGVCAAIVPWNFPFPCIAWKIAPALAAGCTVVVKSAERAPLSAQYLGRLVAEAGIPDGVVNVVMGRGEEAGRALVADPRVDKVTFTGEAATAQEIVRSSLGHMPRVTFELGDKTPNVILADAKLEDAIPAAASGAFGVSGQNCCAGSRLVVDRRVYQEVVEGVAAIAGERKLGDPLDESTDQGPQIDLAHVSRIDGYVTAATAAGANCIVGGEPTGDGGQFYRPTLLADVTSEMAISREEVFGPVGAVIPFDGLDQAIEVANDRDFGLAAAVWTQDERSAAQFARRVRSGTCWINCYEYFDSVAPWGGRKLSGHGRELGARGLGEFLESKTIVRVP